MKGAIGIREGTFRLGMSFYSLFYSLTPPCIPFFNASQAPGAVSKCYRCLHRNTPLVYTGIHHWYMAAEGWIKVPRTGGGKEKSIPDRKRSVETNMASSSPSEWGRDRQERGECERPDRVWPRSQVARQRHTFSLTGGKEFRMCGKVGIFQSRRRQEIHQQGTEWG